MERFIKVWYTRKGAVPLQANTKWLPLYAGLD
jgi:hypothetical protein